MKGEELYARVRYAVRIEGISGREAARRFGIDPRTVAKMLLFSLPSGYRRSRPAGRVVPAPGPAAMIGRAARAHDRRASRGRGTMAGLAFRVSHGPLTDRFAWHGSTPKRDVTKPKAHSALRHHPSDGLSAVSAERVAR
jgi:hypothetical protein